MRWLVCLTRHNIVYNHVDILTSPIRLLEHIGHVVRMSISGYRC